jgi:Mg2+-importing ATPase
MSHHLTRLISIKYIKMVSSSNFGNVFSILIASCWLPFSPMTALQILIQNLLYDLSQIAIPWDRMDAEYVAQPQRWDIKDLIRFILVLGPTSSTIDICTFCINWFYYGIQSAEDEMGVKLFHTHWFLEGLLTQTLIVHLLRTAKIPVFQSRAAKVVVASTVGIMLVGFSIPFIHPIAESLALVRPMNSFIGLLVAELVFYCVEVQVVKMIYIKCFGKWL